MPGLAELADEFGGRVGFLTLLGDFDTGKASAISITESAGAPFLTADAFHSDFQRLMQLLSSGFVPTTVLIGADGDVLGGQIVGAGKDMLRAAITDALG